MTERGVIAVDRGLFGHPRFAPEPFTEREAWIWMISEAAFRDHARRVNGLTIKLRRGQLAHSLRFMAEKWQWSVKRVRRFLSLLSTDYGAEDEAMIDASIDTGVTVVTIRKYNSYQRWLRLSETPHVPLQGTGLGTATDTAATTGQTELNLYPTTKILDEIEKRGTAATTAKGTAATTGRAQEGHKEESIASSSSSSEEQPPRNITTVTEWDLRYAASFVRAIKLNPIEADTGLEAAAQYAVVWRTRGYDMEWAIALGAEIAHDKRKTKPPLSYFNIAIQRRQDERLAQIAREANLIVTPPPACPGTGHAASASTDDWKRHRDRARADVAEFRARARAIAAEGSDSGGGQVIELHRNP